MHDSFSVQVLVKGDIGVLLKYSGKVKLTETCLVCNLFQGYIFVEMIVDIVAYGQKDLGIFNLF